MAKIIHDLSLLDISPPSISKDENIRALITALNPELASTSRDISDVLIISEINKLPERVIDLLAWQWHVDFYEPDLDLATKRALVLNSIKYHKKKGTKYAIKTALEALGFVPTIKEWFEPEMQTVPHTFSITGYYKDDEINTDFLGENTEEILKRVVEITKPVRSSLIYLLVAPTPIDLSEHICKWDFCRWEHFEEKIYDWGNLYPDVSIFEDNAVIKRLFEREIFTIHDTAFWGVNTWDCIPVRNLKAGSCSENAVIADFEWGEGEQSLLFPNIWDFSKWDYAANFTRNISSIVEKIFDVNIDISGNSQLIAAVKQNKILYDLRPRWDLNSWIFHDEWVDDFARDISKGFNIHRDFDVKLDAENLSSKWSKFFSWQSEKTWINTINTNLNWEIKTWEE